MKEEGLDLREVPDGYVVYSRALDKIHFLNPTAAIVLELCDGTRSLDAVSAALQELFVLPKPPKADVAECLRNLCRDGLVTLCDPVDFQTT